MKAKFFLPFLILSLVHLTLKGQDVAAEFLAIDSFLKKEYPQKGPGAAVLIAKGGEVIFEKAYGLADVKKRRPINTDMVFQIGSMTKQFTSAAILQLVEQQKVSLDDPIQMYVEDFPEKEFPLTIHHLLSQTSGIPEFFDVDEEEFYLLAQEHTPQQLIAYYRDQPLLFEPGTRFQYSNSNYPLLGVVVEKVSGLPLAAYFEANLFLPLGMHTTSLWYHKGMKKKHIPNGYRMKNGELVDAPPMVGSVTYAAGGMVSTLEDLLIWNRELHAPKVLSADLVSQLTTEKYTHDHTGTTYGYGFFLRELQGKRTIQHGGNMYGFTSSGLYLPEEDLFVCILANKSLERTEAVANYLASVVMGQPLEILDRFQMGYEAYREYMGTYRLRDASKLIEIRLIDDVLVLDFPEARGTAARLTIRDKDKMESKEANFKIQFTRDSNDLVVGFTADQNGLTEWVKTK